ncbi:phage tail tube protein [Spirosoma pollinicola]|uniref:Phage tail protein n=1 Tax=Spirosoma pollinicola TaxID=2057025 RepID=A0A2K8YTH3_9BACT|nr:hypothetical protein [Spirosoma pollinicola]AUD00935.1 hypothetical protein CWM47_03355 [Spirosoma pollinicola]
MGKYTIGIAKIEFADVASDGGPGTTGLTQYGLTLEGTGKLNEADPTKTQFFVEEQDAAVYEKSKAGDITLTFSIANPDTDTMAKLFGGTAAGTSPNKIWNRPDTLPTIEKTVKITPADGLIIIIPRGSVTAKLDGELSRTNLFVIAVTITALKPTKTGVGVIQFGE